MSLFGENSDSRNSVMGNILLTRINTNMNRISLRRCAFCSRYDHDLSICNNEGFMIICADLINNKKKILNDISISYNDKKDVFCADIRWEAELSENKKHRLKCYAIRFCDAAIDDDYFTWTMKICDKIYNMSRDEEMAIINNLNSPDYLAFDENDALNYLIDADNLIRENNHTININEEINERYTDSGLRLLSFIAQIRMEEMLDEIVREPVENSEKYHEIDCCLDSTISESETKVLHECSICYEEKEFINFATANCGHEFCCECIKNTIKSTNMELKCAMCRTKLTSLKFRSKEICENF